MTATIVLRSWQIIWATTDINVAYTISLYRNSDFGGGVGGLLYAENADSSGLNYKHYNLRGDIVATTDSECSILVQYLYEAFGAIIETYGISPSDRYRSNRKYRDGYINEGRRWRTTSATGFISPDPLEYIDGLNCYAYCGNNPWGRFDTYGLYYDLSYLNEEDRAYVENIIENISRNNYGKGKNSAFYRINNSDDINVRIEVSHGFWAMRKIEMNIYPKKRNTYKSR